MKKETLKKYFGDMPPLDHYPNRGVTDFRWEDSEIMQFMIRQKGLMNNLFFKLNHSGAIVFDPETKKWRGYRWKHSETMEVSEK